MARPKSGALLEAKLEEAERLKAEIRKLKNAARDKIRAGDKLREKVLGRIVLEHVMANPESELALSVNRLLAGQLKRPSERELFPELSATKSPADEGKVA
jgi:hypothetical protein